VSVIDVAQVPALGGKDISEVLGMPVTEARDFFTSGPARAILDRLTDVGLGYLGLGQPLTTLSGGERQRLKADWLIDLGPGAGHDGGRVVFTGTPDDLVAHGVSLTARHLRTYLGELERNQQNPS